MKVEVDNFQNLFFFFIIWKNTTYVWFWRISGNHACRDQDLWTSLSPKLFLHNRLFRRSRPHPINRCGLLSSLDLRTVLEECEDYAGEVTHWVIKCCIY